MNHDITNEVLTEFSTAFSSNPVNRIAMNAVTSAGLLAASKNPMAQRESRHSYSTPPSNLKATPSAPVACRVRCGAVRRAEPE